MPNMPNEAISLCLDKIAEIEKEIEVLKTFRDSGTIADQWKTLLNSKAAGTSFMGEFAEEIFDWAEVKVIGGDVKLFVHNFVIKLPTKHYEDSIYVHYGKAKWRKYPEMPYLKEIDEYTKYGTFLKDKKINEATKMLFPKLNWFARMIKFMKLEPMYRDANVWLEKASTMQKSADKIHAENVKSYNEYISDKEYYEEHIHPLVISFAGNVFKVKIH